MKRPNFIDAEREAESLKPSVSELPQIKINQHELTIPPDDFKYIFKLQVDIEKGLDEQGNKVREARMDYREYARRLWEKYIGPVPYGQEFWKFTDELVAGMHGIDMRPMVYADIQKDMIWLTDLLRHTVKKAILWSTGDVSATGYQVQKIKSSRIILDTLRAYMKLVPDPKTRRAEFSAKTEYMVEDDKYKAMRKYLEDKKANGETSVKIAVIEDSLSAIDRVKKIVAEVFGDQAEVVPVWAIYSRDGQAAKKKAADEGKSEEFDTKCADLNAISAFSDVLRPRLMARLKDSEVLVDFDGVIGNNIDMRNVQAQVIYGTLMKAKAAYTASR